MASWKSLLNPCSNNLFKVDVIWNDGQESYVKKFNNGIPTLVHNADFYKNAQFFLILSGKRKQNITGTAYIELPSIGKVKLFSCYKGFAELFKLHWESVGVDVISVDDNVTKKERRPDKKTIETVFEFFNNISKNLDKDAIKKSNEMCDVLSAKLHETYLASKPVGKPRGRKPKVLTPQEIAHRDRIQAQKQEMRRVSSRKARTVSVKASRTQEEPRVIVNVDINKYISESLTESCVSKKAIKCTINRDEDGVYHLNSDAEKDSEIAKVITSAPIPFKTRSAAKAAKALIEQSHEQKNTLSPFSLYLTTNKGGVDGKTFHKICSGVENLMNIIADDWSGTPIGYSLHKTTNSSLGKMMTSSNVPLEIIKKMNNQSNKVGFNRTN
ncbi:hypothetical protein [Vibrio sp. D431a]|uniref:hypothetical protein n=1 Tax=Vibrio sp. D431a TaxID=2837388 RepID=UPI0025526B25|nr:hypothetical protein [Vibrio sp. D431a]MDK9790685.1 hypothetical protein [Vibrio sp. D431a]